MNLPFCAGIPSAPGYVPKYVSKERFSCMMMTICLIFCRAMSSSGETVGVGVNVGRGVAVGGMVVAVPMASGGFVLTGCEMQAVSKPIKTRIRKLAGWRLALNIGGSDLGLGDFLSVSEM